MNEEQPKMRKRIGSLFYGNYFYGLCAVVLVFETNLRLELGLKSPFFYFACFLLTLLVYSWPFLPKARGNASIDINVPSLDERGRWFMQHALWVKCSLGIAMIYLLIWLLWRTITVAPSLVRVPWEIFFFGLIFGLAAILYYPKILPGVRGNLRQIGWIKPFLIGLAWTGLCGYFPWALSILKETQFVLPSSLLPLVRQIFEIFTLLTALAVLFDIKDYRLDKRVGLRSIPVILGVRRSIYAVVIPVILLNLGFNLWADWYQQASWSSATLHALPYLLLLPISLQLIQPKSLLFYLSAIDGFILLKACCGIFAHYA